MHICLECAELIDKDTVKAYRLLGVFSGEPPKFRYLQCENCGSKYRPLVGGLVRVE